MYAPLFAEVRKGRTRAGSVCSSARDASVFLRVSFWGVEQRFVGVSRKRWRVDGHSATDATCSHPIYKHAGGLSKVPSCSMIRQMPYPS